MMASRDPRLARQDATDLAPPQAMFGREPFDHAGVFRPHRLYVFLGQSSSRMLLTHRTNAIDQIISSIFYRQRPTQILGTIVQSIPIAMRSLMDGAGGRAVESLAYQAVNLLRGNFARKGKVKLAISIRDRLGHDLPGVSAGRRRSSAYPAKAGNLIVWRPRKRSPFFRLVHGLIYNHKPARLQESAANGLAPGGWA